jgi:colanic acid/amylovoran biosynthesis protein
MKPVKIAIMGTPVSSSNRGVLALGNSLVNIFYAVEKSIQITFILGHRDNKPVSFRIAGKSKIFPIVNCRMSPRARYCDHLVWISFVSILYRIMPIAAFRRALTNSTPWVAALEEADIVGDIRGGDSFSDIYGMKRFLYGFMMAWTVLLIKGSMVQFPQTFGPFNSPISRWLARYLLNKSEIIMARDKKSQEVALFFVGLNRNVVLSPDVAFFLESIRPNSIKFAPPLSRQVSSNAIGVNVNGLLYYGGYTRNNMFGLKLNYRLLVPELLNALLMEQSSDIWLIPHTYGPSNSVESDPEANRQVWRTLSTTNQKRVHIVAEEYDQHELKGIIGQCDMFIGSRMHACIAALSQGVPCIGIAYSMKFKGVFDSVGMDDWVIDGREVSNERAVASALNLYRNRDIVRQDLKRKSELAKNRLKEVFQQLIETKRDI